MSQVKIGNWYLLEESFEANGDIDIAIRDKRNPTELLAFTIESFEAYDQLITFLSENQHVEALQHLKASK